MGKLYNKVKPAVKEIRLQTTKLFLTGKVKSNISAIQNKNVIQKLLVQLNNFFQIKITLLSRFLWNLDI